MCSTWVVSRWGISDTHGNIAQALLIEEYVDDRTKTGARRPAPFDKRRGSVHNDVMRILMESFAHLAHTEHRRTQTQTQKKTQTNRRQKKGYLYARHVRSRWTRSTQIVRRTPVPRQDSRWALEGITPHVPTPVRSVHSPDLSPGRAPPHMTPQRASRNVPSVLS